MPQGRGPATAQTTGNHLASPAAARLIDLPGFGFRVRVSPGLEPSGARVAERARRAHDWLAEIMSIRAPLDLHVLDLQDWRAVVGPDQPFGVPSAWLGGAMYTTVEPAPFWQETLDFFEPDLDDATRHLLRASFGDPPDLGAGMLDMAIVHEVAHLYHLLDDVPIHPRAALAELFANLAMYGYCRDVEPGVMPRLEAAVAAARRVRLDRLPITHVRDVAVAFEQENGAAVDMWYLLMFVDHAVNIWQAAGPAALPGLQRVIRTPLEWEETEAALDAVHPALGDVVRTWPRAVHRSG